MQNRQSGHGHPAPFLFLTGGGLLPGIVTLH
jgi:hypothetical protein